MGNFKLEPTSFTLFSDIKSPDFWTSVPPLEKVILPTLASFGIHAVSLVSLLLIIFHGYGSRSVRCISITNTENVAAAK